MVNGVPVQMSFFDRRVPHNLRLKRKKPGRPSKARVIPMGTLTIQERKDLNVQQREALANYFSGMKKRDAGVTAGYSPTSAIASVNNALTLAAGNKAFKDAMVKAGIDFDSLATTLKDGLKAKHPIKPEQKDYHAIHKFWQDAVKLVEAFPATKIQTSGDQRHLHVHLTGDDAANLNKYQTMRRGEG